MSFMHVSCRLRYMKVAFVPPYFREFTLFIHSTVREANDACLWLKAAGFPQYVQMFEGQYYYIQLLQCVYPYM